MRALLRFFRALGPAFDRAHPRWARAHLSKHNPLHEDLPAIVQRLRQLEDRR
jgi:hypothetical protein